jgi:hypothetical protein
LSQAGIPGGTGTVDENASGRGDGDVTSARPGGLMRRAATASATVAAAALLLSACGSTEKTGSTASAPTASRATTSAPSKPTTSQAHASSSNGEVANVCSLLTSQQIDAVLGAGFTPTTYGGTPRGYFPSAFTKKYASGNYLHKVYPSLNLIAYANCDWINDTVSLEQRLLGRLHPTFNYSLLTFSSGVSEGEYRHAYGTGFVPVAGLGQWALYDQAGNELVVGVGYMVLTLTNVDIYLKQSLQGPYSQLAKIIVGDLP